MKIQRFTAATSREAHAKARISFGEGTLILSTRPTDTGVEIIATAEQTLLDLEQMETFQVTSDKKVSGKNNTSPVSADSRLQVEDDALQLSMSTLSFQDYVRERMLRKRHEEISEIKVMPEISVIEKRAPQKLEVLKPSSVPPGIAHELQEMKHLIEDRFNAMAWLGKAHQNPIHTNLMLKMIRSGYSPMLTRSLMQSMPEKMGVSLSFQWLRKALANNIKTSEKQFQFHQEGGAHAFVGSTGVGKTTTIAKLAYLCTQEYGSAAVGLITLDTFRAGAHDQLRALSRDTGVATHIAQDREALQDLLNLLSTKKLILIDTAGYAPNDIKNKDTLDMIDMPHIHRTLVLNAGSHGDTLDDVVCTYKSIGIQHAVLTKLDEAAKMGPVIDTLIRHQLILRGMSTGQRILQDWAPGDAQKLVEMSMRSPVKSAFDPIADDLDFFFTRPDESASRSIHA